jgi:hypothetical protein
MTSTDQKRAAKGGQIGVNGEFYEGGKFLPSTDRSKGKPKPKRPAGKVQVEPYRWEIAPEGMFPIMQIIGAQAAWIDRYSPDSGIEPFANGVAYYGDTHKGHKVADLCAAWNRGERWATIG